MSHFAEAMQSDFQTLAPQFPGADVPWLRDIRERAFERFKTADLPTLRDEQWKYTDLDPLQGSAFKSAGLHTSDAVDTDMLDVSSVPQLSDHRLVFVNGTFNGALSTIETLPSGVTFSDLYTVLKTDCHRLEDHFRSGANRDASVLAALNSAFVFDGALIEIEADVEIREPLHVIFINRGSATPTPLMTAPRVIIRAGANSRCAVVESYQSASEASTFTNALTEIIAGPASSIEHYRIQREAGSAYHFANVFVAGRRDSTVACHSIALGSALARVDIDAALTEPGSSVILNGLFFAGDRQHVDHHTRIDHFVRDTHSAENFKGILDGSGRGVFNGKVVVHPDAQHITATQSNKNLLLSPNAEMDTKPELEIYADDVKCSHGATVGQLDHSALFYLRSRGVGEPEARALLTFAFTQDVVHGMSHPSICDWLERSIMSRIGASTLLAETI